MKLLKWLWQLPQNLLGLIVILLTRARKTAYGYYFTKVGAFGVSLGDYIIFGGIAPSVYNIKCSDVKHEHGHQIQSLYLGPLYLIIIGLPSIIGNICDRVLHRKWSLTDRYTWYYSLPWEAWADRLGKCVRNIN